MNSREAFEEWLRGTTGFKKCKARGVPMSFQKNVCGDYRDYRVNDRWLAWQAALRWKAGT